MSIIEYQHQKTRANQQSHRQLPLRFQAVLCCHASKVWFLLSHCNPARHLFRALTFSLRHKARQLPDNLQAMSNRASHLQRPSVEHQSRWIKSTGARCFFRINPMIYRSNGSDKTFIPLTSLSRVLGRRLKLWCSFPAIANTHVLIIRQLSQWLHGVAWPFNPYSHSNYKLNIKLRCG